MNTKAVPKKDVDFESLANKIMFGKGVDFNVELIEFRKGKSVDDVRKSVRRAEKLGGFKAENTLGFLEIYLSRIFKKKHKLEESK